MAKFPEPPSAPALSLTKPEVRVLAAGVELWRVYFRGGDHPTLWKTMRSFGPVGARFDHHLPPARLQPDRAVIYLAESGPTCLAEVFQDTRVIDRSSRDPWLVAFSTAAPLRLLDLTGAWPTRAGASMAMSTGPRSRAQRWARVIYDAYPALQGVYYPSSMHRNLPSVAVWDRGAGALPRQPTFHRALVDPALLVPLENVARDLGYGLV